MSAEQLVVLVLLAAAFAAGWVARGGDARAEPSAAEPDDGDDDAAIRTAKLAYLAAVDAWLDGLSPEDALPVFDAARAAVTAPAEAVEALDDAAEVLERFRAGYVMTAADSTRLEEAEERLGLADPA